MRCDDKFIDRSFQGTSETDVGLKMIDDGLRAGSWGGASGILQIDNGRQIIARHGAKHTYVDRVFLHGYTFDSDKSDPLQFLVDRDKGYVYVKGKGSVTMPDGMVVRLPRIPDDVRS